MLNCGGLVDLSEFFTLSPEVTLYVIDSHRPHNLHNVFGSGQVGILCLNIIQLLFYIIFVLFNQPPTK